MNESEILECLSYKFETGYNLGKSLALVLLKGQYMEWHKKWLIMQAQNHEHKNKLHQALNYYFVSVLPHLKPTKICPHCHRNSVIYFAVKDIGYFDIIDLNHISCNEEFCKKELMHWSGCKKLHKISFENYAMVSRIGNRLPIKPENVSRLLACVYQIPKDLNDSQMAIDFFIAKLKIKVPKSNFVLSGITATLALF